MVRLAQWVDVLRRLNRARRRGDAGAAREAKRDARRLERGDDLRQLVLLFGMHGPLEAPPAACASCEARRPLERRTRGAWLCERCASGRLPAGERNAIAARRRAQNGTEASSAARLSARAIAGERSSFARETPGRRTTSPRARRAATRGAL